MKIYTVWLRKKLLTFELDLHEHRPVSRHEHLCDVVECDDVGFSKALNPLIDDGGRAVPYQYDQADVDRLVGECVLAIAMQSPTQSFEIKISYFGTVMCLCELAKQAAAVAEQQKNKRVRELQQTIEDAQVELRSLS